MFKLFGIKTADEASIAPDYAEIVTGDERAVILQFRYFDESQVTELHTKFSISQIRKFLSLAQESALISEDYQALEAHELLGLAEILFCATPNTTHFQSWSTKGPDSGDSTPSISGKTI